MVIVLGSINIDLVFSVPVLPRAGETVLGPAYTSYHGGKGANQAVAAARYGAKVEMAGAVGRDAFGLSAADALKHEKVGTGCLKIVDAPTGCASIGLDAAGQNQIMVASGANALVRDAMVPESMLEEAGTVLAQLEIPAVEVWHFLRRAKQAGARTLLNAAPARSVPPEVLACLDVLVVNELESVTVAQASGLSCGDEQTASRLLARHGCLDVITTLGEEGAVLYRADGTSLAVPAFPVRPVDTTGAGDTFCGVLAACLDEGMALEEAIRHANAAGALSCLRQGARTAMPGVAEVKKLLASSDC